MDKVTAALYQQYPEKYTLVSGHQEGAPTGLLANPGTPSLAFCQAFQ